MHAFASKASEVKGIGHISQAELCFTTFGFMGFALIRPDLLGIKHDKTEDLIAFTHFWAVIGHMLGIDDKYNICMFPLEVVEIIYKIINKHFVMTWFQLETPLFKKMATSLIDGMGLLIPFSTYESRMFLAKRLCGVPGYQYDLDVSKELSYKSYFTDDEFHAIQQSYAKRPGFEYLKSVTFNNKTCIIEIKKFDHCQHEQDINPIEDLLDNMDENRNIFGLYKGMDEELMLEKASTDKKLEDKSEFQDLLKVLGVKHESEILLTEVSDSDRKKYWNDKKFRNLTSRDKFLVRYNIHTTKMLQYKMSRMLSESVVSLICKRVEKEVAKNSRH